MLETETKQTDEMRGKPFPCPVCGMTLPIEISKRQKPYCTCFVCGLQLFFRGKTGIRRLHELLRAERPLEPETMVSNQGVALYNRLATLKKQREELEEKQGLIFKDRDLANTIATLDAEINRLHLELERVGREAEKKNK